MGPDRKQAFLGSSTRNRGIEMIGSLGGHYFRDAAVKISGGQAILQYTSEQLTDAGLDQRMSQSVAPTATEGTNANFDFYFATFFNQWSLPGNAPWSAPPAGTADPELVSISRFLSLEEDSFVRLNDGRSWRAVMYPGFDPANPSSPASESGGLFYWNLSGVEQVGVKTNWVAKLRRQMHRDRMAKVAALYRRWPHKFRYFTIGGETEMPWYSPAGSTALQGNIMADYGVFTLEEFRNWQIEKRGSGAAGLAALNAAHGTNFGSWADVTPPWGAGNGPSPGAAWNCIKGLDAGCSVNTWSDEWLEFRRIQLARLIQEMIDIAVAEGIPPHLIITHQIPVENFTATQLIKSAMSRDSYAQPVGRNGNTCYGALCTNTSFLGHARESTVYWGLGEFNPWFNPVPSPTQVSVMQLLSTIWESNPRSWAFHTFNREYGIFDEGQCASNLSCSWTAPVGSGAIRNPLDPRNPSAGVVAGLQAFLSSRRDSPRIAAGQGVHFVLADTNGDGLDEVLTQLGERADARNESVVEIWY